MSPTQLFVPENIINITKTNNSILVNNSYDELGTSFLANPLATDTYMAA